MRILILFLVFSLPSVRLLAQDWGAVQALAVDTPVRIGELGGRGGQLRGRIRAVEDAQLTVLVKGKPIVVPRSSIGRIEREERDSIWNGVIIGAGVMLVLRAFGGLTGEGCLGRKEPHCTLAGVAMGAAFGALIDYENKKRTVIYVSGPTVTLLRLSF